MIAVSIGVDGGVVTVEGSNKLVYVRLVNRDDGTAEFWRCEGAGNVFFVESDGERVRVDETLQELDGEEL